MENIPDYIKINKETWNKKTAVHVASDFYNNEAFLNGKSSLNSFEIDLLGDVSHKKILHLQCHFGQDTLSLARLGAKVTGIDFSDEAIEKANNTPFGLSAGIWTEKGSRILEVAHKLRAGVIWANTFNKFDPASPFGGYKESGWGREGGRHGLAGYLTSQVKESK